MQRTQSWVGAVLVGLAVAALVVGAWSNPAGGVDLNQVELLLLALCALAGIIAAYVFPIHIHFHTKVCLTTVPLYLAAGLLPAPLAALIIGAATLVGETLVRKERGNLPGDVAVTTLRWMAIGLVSGLIAQLPTGGSPLFEAARLVGAAVFMFLGDSLTTALHIAFISREPPGPILRAVWREAGLIELVQYMLGLLGALAARQYIWSPVLLLVPLAIVYVAFKRAKELQSSTRQMLANLADAVDLRDAYTGGHSRRVAELVTGILHTVSLGGPEADLICSAARVHDIGKIGIPDDVLHKTARLEPAELKIMQAHPEHGAQLLARYPDFARGAAIVRHHHERWDGRGYPAGLKATNIPYGARVIAVADSYDAMTSTRPYRSAMTPNEAARILRGGAGTQWDKDIVEAFLKSLGDVIDPSLATALPDNQARLYSMALSGTSKR